LPTTRDWMLGASRAILTAGGREDSPAPGANGSASMASTMAGMSVYAWQERLALQALPGRSEQGASLIIGAVHENRQEEAAIDGGVQADILSCAA